jgi:NhaA family Na+:H+ antiporter
MSGEAAGGVALMVAAAVALLLANTALAPAYFGFLKTHVAGMSILHWVNDALMAVFFLLIGLEIKRELVDGQLSTWRRRMLPGVAAAGGMVAPALIYFALNAGLDTLRGWAIPTATDIAFALGVLALLGSRVPVSLKVFLTALAILDDLGAIAIIAVFYATNLSFAWLAAAAATLAVLAALKRAGVRQLWAYLAIGALLWVFVLQSGVHATIAGVALAFAIPIDRSPGRTDKASSPLHQLEHALHPWVTFLILPIFGLANAGVPLGGVRAADLAAPLPLGVAAGLFLGKQLGVFLAVWASVKLGGTHRPDGASLAQVYGVALLCGVGFTMSLFIGLLAFPESEDLQNALKIGVLAGSIASALAGSAVLVLVGRRSRQPV